MPVAAQSLPVLYHGTSTARATAIRRGGFRRSKSASYTGTAVNLADTVCMAWEYGPVRAGRFWRSLFRRTPDGRTTVESTDWNCDARFASGELDALRAFAGNVWLLWNPEVVAAVRALTFKEIMVKALAEWRADGRDVGYNGDMGQLADLYWNGEAAVRKSLGVCAPADFDRNAWKDGVIARYKRLLSLAGVSPGDGASISF